MANLSTTPSCLTGSEWRDGSLEPNIRAMTASRPPNILWVSFEDTYPFYACYGDPVARTPNLDRLAAEGCLYENAFSTAPVSAPARSAIITGMYAISTGAHHMRTCHVTPDAPELPTPYEAVPPPEVKCFPEFLRAAGYYCTNRIKTDYQFDSPISAWDEHGPDAHWRKRPDPDLPFFAVFNFEETHESQSWEDMGFAPRFDPSEIPVPPYLPDTPKVRASLAKVYTLIEDNDRRLGELLDQLEEDGLTENTIVMHWSDHGPLPRGKRWLYDSGIRVPLIVRWPGRTAPGSRENRMVSTVDLGPTTLSVCGLPIPPYMQGKVFLGDHQDPPREYVFASRDRMDNHYDRIRAARDERFKYIRNYYPYESRFPWISYLNRHPIMQELRRLHLHGKLTPEQNQLFETPRAVEELYDTRADPHELHNLAGTAESGAILGRFRTALDGWIEETGDLGAIAEFEMVRRWRPDGVTPATALPRFSGISENDYGQTALETAASLTAPCKIQISSATQGSSIVYQWKGENPSHWNLYSSPLALSPGHRTLRSRATRLGYLPSPISEIQISVEI